MRWLLFLSRLAFICGIFFILSLSLLMGEWISEENIVATIITIGVYMGIIIVPITSLCYLGVFIIIRKLKSYVPLWLIISNIIFLLLFFYYIFYLNVT